MRDWVTIGLLALGSAMPAAAQQSCPVPPGLQGFTAPMAVRAGAALRPGRAVRTMLLRGARLPIVPEKAPAAGTHGGAFRLLVTRPGRYRVAVDGPLWIEVGRGGLRLAAVAHGHAPACSGARKLVDFDLQPGTYTVQLSGGKTRAATLMVAEL